MRPYGYLNRQYSVRHIRRTYPRSYDDMASHDPVKGTERNNIKKELDIELNEIGDYDND